MNTAKLKDLMTTCCTQICARVSFHVLFNEKNEVQQSKKALVFRVIKTKFVEVVIDGCKRLAVNEVLPSWEGRSGLSAYTYIYSLKWAADGNGWCEWNYFLILQTWTFDMRKWYGRFVATMRITSRKCVDFTVFVLPVANWKIVCSTKNCFRARMAFTFASRLFFFMFSFSFHHHTKAIFCKVFIIFFF